MLFSIFLGTLPGETACIDGRHATWKNPALALRVMDKLDLPLREAAHLVGASRRVASGSAVQWGPRGGRAASGCSIPAGWLSAVSLHRHSSHYCSLPAWAVAGYITPLLVWSLYPASCSPFSLVVGPGIVSVVHVGVVVSSVNVLVSVSVFVVASVVLFFFLLSLQLYI